MYENGTLLLVVKSEPYDVECEACQIRHEESEMGGIIGASRPETYDPVEALENCSCGGTGSRSTRLEGKVGVEFSDSIGGLQWYKIVGTKIGWSKYVLLEKIIEMHKSGTLPAELYASDDNPEGLKEVPVQSDADLPPLSSFRGILKGEDTT